MRYTIEGFSQIEAVKFRRTETVKRKNQRTGEYEDKEALVALDCTDLVILRWFVDFWPNMMKVEIGGVQYAWLSYKDAIKDMPLLGVKKAAFALRLKKMVSFGILSHKTVKSNGTFSYYGFGPEYGRLIDTDHAQQNSDHAQNINEGVHKKLETPAQNFSDQIDSSTKDSSTKDNQEEAASRKVPIREIIAHLNEVTGKRYSPKSKDTVEKINARWSEYSDMPYDERLAMFLGMIDTMFVCWKGTKWEPYLKPSTLFKPTKFEGYVNMTPKKWEEWDSKDGRTQRSKPQRQMDFSEYAEPKVGSMRTDNRTNKTEIYKGNGVWEEYVSDYDGEYEDIDY